MGRLATRESAGQIRGIGSGKTCPLHVLILVVCGIVVHPAVYLLAQGTGQCDLFSYQRTEGFDAETAYSEQPVFLQEKSFRLYADPDLPADQLFLIRRYNRYIQWAVVAYAAVNFLLAS